MHNWSYFAAYMLEHPRTIDVERKQSKCTKCGERVVDISQSRLVAVVASVAVRWILMVRILLYLNSPKKWEVFPINWKHLLIIIMYEREDYLLSDRLNLLPG